VAKIEGDIARFDAANQKFITDREVERKATQDRIDELEKKINRGAISGSAAVEREVRALEAKETFFAFARFGHPTTTAIPVASRRSGASSARSAA
jgi:hypothetical protein